MALRKLWFDFETMWSDDYTLSKMTPIEYILDPRFEALGCAFVDDKGVGQWVDGPNLPDFFQSIDWSNTFAVSHNALFDALILAHRYGVVPGFYGDTLSMAQNWLVHSTGRVSLAACSEHYGLPPKWDTAQKMKGIGYAAMVAIPELHDEVGRYAIDDAGKCRTLFDRMRAEGFPTNQLEVIDLVVRMAALPQFELDQVLLCEHLAEIQANKRALLEQAELDPDEPPDNLMSAVKFEMMLLMSGLFEIPKKWSEKQNKIVPAFAKTDRAFTDLLEHPNPRIQTLVAARLGHKTTLEESRTERMITISRLTPKTPVPLIYSGAHTHRFSGGWKINMQNLPNAGKLRHCLRAPEGYRVVSVDASQIEARINATLSGQRNLMDAFASGRDVYCEFATRIYGRTITRADKDERFIGKTAVLQLGYGSSAFKFQHMCRTKGGMDISDAEAGRIVQVYRTQNHAIKANWGYAENVVLPAIRDGKELQWGPLVIEHQRILLPNGNYLRYRDLKWVQSERDENRFEWTYMRGKTKNYIYGAKLVENVVQALAFVHIMEVALRVKAMTDGQLLPAHQIHDELIYVVPAHLAEKVALVVQEEMSKPPAWMPDAPLAAEKNIGQTYGETK